MRRRPFLLASLATWAARDASSAVVVEGVRFDEQLQLAGQALLLNGTGVRAVAWLKGYAAALYLTRRARSAEEVQSAPGPKRLRMVMLLGAPAGEFVKAFEKGLARNSSPAEVDALRERMDRFDHLVEGLGKVSAGDVVDLDFDPGRGTLLLCNGKPVDAAIGGADFNAALLRSFVGVRPYDKQLRAGLLGLTA